MTNHFYYSPEYSNSWALIIGINSYQHVPPLQYARNDAEAVAKILTEKFGFEPDNVQVLVDVDATRQRIMDAFLEYALDEVEPDDRVLVFFAGHGYTHTGKRSEVGFLVPVDGMTDNLATLIRWDELTRNADLIPAKHILFIMDACYGGLAITRSLKPGSMRFLKDMLQRYARQVITAGKADEPVLDLGGPVPGHSIFSGYLLEGLQGKAASSDGIITANGVMSYVYDKVSKDGDSEQTPHFGFLEGDGDFIFQADPLNTLPDDPETDEDILFQVPPTPDTNASDEAIQDLAGLTKEYISDERYKIKLDDLSTRELKRFKSLTSDDRFPVHSSGATTEEVLDRLKQYEDISHNLQVVGSLLSHWGAYSHMATLRKIIMRISELSENQSGSVLLLNLRWWPITVLMYSWGISAIAAENYKNLSAILKTKSGKMPINTAPQEIILDMNEAMTELARANLFKNLPGHEQHYVPRSEYLFKLLQPTLDDLLFIGTSYDDLFDRFEIIQALVYADLLYEKQRRVWGPAGRFLWKHRGRMRESSPFKRFLSEAESLQNNWPLIQAGFFGGSYSRFEGISSQYLELMNKSNWY